MELTLNSDFIWGLVVGLLVGKIAFQFEMFKDFTRYQVWKISSAAPLKIEGLEGKSLDEIGEIVAKVARKGKKDAE